MMAGSSVFIEPSRVAREDRGQIETKPVHVHLVGPIPQAVQNQRAHGRVARSAACCRSRVSLQYVRRSGRSR